MKSEEDTRQKEKKKEKEKLERERERKTKTKEKDKDKGKKERETWKYLIFKNNRKLGRKGATKRGSTQPQHNQSVCSSKKQGEEGVGMGMFGKANHQEVFCSLLFSSIGRGEIQQKKRRGTNKKKKKNN